MRGFQLILAAAALAALPACNLLAIGGNGGESDSGSGNSVASSEKADAPEEKGEERPRRDREPDEPTRNETARDEPRTETAAADWILGRWGDAGCATVVEFQGDGTFLINGSEGQWQLDGDTLTMSGNGNSQVYTIVRESGGFNIEDGAGNVQQLGRC